MTEAAPLRLLAAAHWHSLAPAAGVFLATFFLEDAATIGAGLLLASGGISWLAAFTACFLGIWLGDFGLYALARWAGRNWFERSRFRRYAPKVAERERWMAGRSVGVIFLCRLIPGARLPGYVAAGFLRVPLPRFLLVTGLASFIWTVGVLWLSQALGAKAGDWLRAGKWSVFWIAALVVVAILGIRSCKFGFARSNRRRVAAWFGRWRRWEFWPPWLFYPPVGLYCVWLGVKHRGWGAATASNPGIFSGGLVGESKWETQRALSLTSPEFTAPSALISEAQVEARLASYEANRARLGLDYPLILKPDVGQRGAGVKLIRSAEQAAEYLRSARAPLLLQQYAPGPLEAGVFYYRFPEEERGRIFAITEKHFPAVTGDGVTTIEELVWRDRRARYVADKYLDRIGERRNEALKAGVKLKLVEAGNHAQGCVFADGMRLWTPQLEARIDEISRRLEGFFIGRYDLRFRAEEDLTSGRAFQIIELNGAASEATSIYDARNSLWSAYRTLFRQWELVFAIGAANCRRGCVPTPLPLVWRRWQEYRRIAASYPPAD